MKFRQPLPGEAFRPHWALSLACLSGVPVGHGVETCCFCPSVISYHRRTFPTWSLLEWRMVILPESSLQSSRLSQVSAAPCEILSSQSSIKLMKAMSRLARTRAYGIVRPCRTGCWGEKTATSAPVRVLFVYEQGQAEGRGHRRHCAGGKNTPRPQAPFKTERTTREGGITMSTDAPLVNRAAVQPTRSL